MQIDFHCQGFTLSDALRAHTERRLAFSLGRSAYHIGRVTVQLADINGPRGGIDKRCRIQVKLEPSLEVVVVDTQSDLYRAIDRASERIGHAVARSLGRQRRARFLARTLRHVALQPATIT